MSRYVIIGAGAVGGVLGGHLARADVSTVLVARGDHGAALMREGLRLCTPERREQIRVDAAMSPEQVVLRPDDVLVLTTKTHQAAEALSVWSDRPVGEEGQRAGDVLPILTALNGVQAEPIALRYFRRVFAVTVWMPALHLAPGEVVARSLPPAVGVFHIGRYPHTTTQSDDDALLTGIRDDWTPAGFGVHLHEDIRPWKYNKLLRNLTNAVQALAVNREAAESLTRAARAEGERVLTQAGISYASTQESDAVRAHGPRALPVPGFEHRTGSSTWQSLSRGTGNVESDYLNGEIAAIAHRFGHSAPINTAIAALMRQAAREGWRPGRLNAEELATQLGVDLPSDAS